MFTNKSLAARSNDFNSLIHNSQFTDAFGTALSMDAGTLEALMLLKAVRDCGGNVYVIGNGGSAAVASHITTDFCNVAGLRSMTLHEPSVITCFSNDFGYEHSYSIRLKKIARQGDLLIAISSSGQSKNILNAVNSARETGAAVITLSGFSAQNPLRQRGDINFWIASDEYGLVEIGHLFTLHHWSDRIGVEWSDECWDSDISQSNIA